MTLRGFTTTEILADGTKHIRWFPESSAQKAERHESARDAAARGLADSAGGRAMLGKKLYAAVMARGVPYRFDMHHWQIRKDGRIVVDLLAELSWQIGEMRARVHAFGCASRQVGANAPCDCEASERFLADDRPKQDRSPEDV